MIMTKTTDNMKRWFKLWKKAPGLAPEHLKWDDSWGWMIRQPFKEHDAEDNFTDEDSWTEIVEEGAGDLIVAAAIKWFNTKHEGLTIADGHWDPDYDGPGMPWSGFAVEVISPVIAENHSSGEILIDALYGAVLVVLEREAEMVRDDRKRNSLVGKIKRRFNDFFDCFSAP